MIANWQSNKLTSIRTMRYNEGNFFFLPRKYYLTILLVVSIETTEITATISKELDAVVRRIPYSELANVLIIGSIAFINSPLFTKVMSNIPNFSGVNAEDFDPELTQAATQINLPSATHTPTEPSTSSATHTPTITLTPNNTLTPTLNIPETAGTAITEDEEYPAAAETKVTTRFIDTAVEMPITKISDNDDFTSVISATADIFSFYKREGDNGKISTTNFLKNQLLAVVRNIWNSVTGEDHYNDIPQSGSHNALLALFTHIDQLLSQDGHEVLLEIATALENEDLLYDGFAVVENTNITIDVAYTTDINPDQPQDTPDDVFHQIYGDSAALFSIDTGKLQKSAQIIQGGVVRNTPAEGDATIGKLAEENGLVYRITLVDGNEIYLLARNLAPLLWRDVTSQIITNQKGSTEPDPTSVIPVTPGPAETPITPATPAVSIDAIIQSGHTLNSPKKLQRHNHMVNQHSKRVF